MEMNNYPEHIKRKAGEPFNSKELDKELVYIIRNVKAANNGKIPKK